jgi:hypothetical protein
MRWEAETALACMPEAAFDPELPLELKCSLLTHADGRCLPTWRRLPGDRGRSRAWSSPIHYAARPPLELIRQNYLRGGSIPGGKQSK